MGDFPINKRFIPPLDRINFEKCRPGLEFDVAETLRPESRQRLLGGQGYRLGRARDGLTGYLQHGVLAQGLGGIELQNGTRGSERGILRLADHTSTRLGRPSRRRQIDRGTIKEHDALRTDVTRRDQSDALGERLSGGPPPCSGTEKDQSSDEGDEPAKQGRPRQRRQPPAGQVTECGKRPHAQRSSGRSATVRRASEPRPSRI